MVEMSEKEKPSCIADYEKLSFFISLELKEVIDVLEMLVVRAGGVPNEFICLMSTPSVLIRALKGTIEKADTLHTIFERKVDIPSKLKEENES